MYFSFRIKAYADYSLATLAEMTTQVYGVDHVGFIRATWTKTKRGWVLRNKNR